MAWNWKLCVDVLVSTAYAKSCLFPWTAHREVPDNTSAQKGTSGGGTTETAAAITASRSADGDGWPSHADVWSTARGVCSTEYERGLRDACGRIWRIETLIVRCYDVRAELVVRVCGRRTGMSSICRKGENASHIARLQCAFQFPSASINGGIATQPSGVKTKYFMIPALHLCCVLACLRSLPLFRH